MMNLTPEQTKVARVIGLVLFVAANGLLTVTGANTGTKSRVLSQICEVFLLTHDEFTMLPENCRAEFRMLRRRLSKTLEDIDRYERDSDLSLPENDGTDTSEDIPK